MMTTPTTYRCFKLVDKLIEAQVDPDGKVQTVVWKGNVGFVFF